MDEIKNRYKRGEVIRSSEWNLDLPFFGEVVWNDFIQDRATAQFDLQEELHWKRVKKEVILTPEQIHLIRPSDLKNGITQNIPTDAEKLALVRHQLRLEMAK